MLKVTQALWKPINLFCLTIKHRPVWIIHCRFTGKALFSRMHVISLVTHSINVTCAGLENNIKQYQIEVFILNSTFAVSDLKFRNRHLGQSSVFLCDYSIMPECLIFLIQTKNIIFLKSQKYYRYFSFNSRDYYSKTDWTHCKDFR